jgi:ABC-type uncharacterized transport system ATPase subunit
MSLAARRALGLRIIPFERNVEGLSLTSSLWENWSARELLQGPLLKLVNPSSIRALCDKALKNWSVHYHSSTQKAGSLSGGNAQKVILAREVDPDAKVIIAASRRAASISAPPPSSGSRCERHGTGEPQSC